MGPGRLRALLDGLYRVSGILAGFFLVCIAVLTVAQIGGRLVGIGTRSLDDFAGFAMAASMFLGLAWTMRRGEHIRMSLLLEHLPLRTAMGVEMAACLVSLVLCAYFSWYAVDMTWTSYRLDDVSQGLVAIPLWIPQLALAAGVVLLTLALVDELVGLLRGGEAGYRARKAGQSATVSSFER